MATLRRVLQPAFGHSDGAGLVWGPLAGCSREWGLEGAVEFCRQKVRVEELHVLFPCLRKRSSAEARQ